MKHFRSPAISLSLSDNGEVKKDIQLFRVGTFYHSEYGKFEITPETLKAMEKNFKDRVRGVDLAIDYKHASEDIAAGWIQDVYLSDDGKELWAKVDWTPQGTKVLSDKEFRYISPEFAWDYQDNETLKSFGPALLGAGLTNRPTIKNMDPVVLSEYKYADGEREKLDQERKDRSTKYGIEVTQDSALTPPSGQPTDESQYGDPVNFKFPMPDAGQAGNARVRFKQFANQIYKQDSSKSKVHERIVKRELELGVSPDFDPKDSLDALLSGDLKQKLMKKKGIKAMDLSKIQPADLDSMSPDELKALCKQLLDAMQKDAAADSAGTEMADMKKKLDDMQKTAACAEKKLAFAKLLSEGKACKAQEQSFIDGDMAKFLELAQPLKLNEGVGSSTIPPVQAKEEDPETQVIKLAEAKMKENPKLDHGRAISQVLKENPTLKQKIYA